MICRKYTQYIFDLSLESEKMQWRKTMLDLNRKHVVYKTTINDHLGIISIFEEKEEITYEN